MTLNLASQIRRNGSLLHADAGEDIVMLSIEAGEYYSLDQVGRRIWELIAQPMTIGEVCGRLRAEYDVVPEVCEAQVLAFLAELAEHKVIEVAAQ